MPKISILFFAFTLVYFFTITTIIKPVFAATCSNQDIKFDPSVFTEGTTITPILRLPQTVIDNLARSGKNYLQLNIGYGRAPNEVEQHVLKLDSTSFVITIRHPNLKQVGPHDGEIKLSSSASGPFNENLCTNITYEVKPIDKKCTLDPDTKALPRTLPPGIPVVIKFAGFPNTQYKPYFRREGAFDNYSPVTTDSNGQGIVTIAFTRGGGAPAQNGDVFLFFLQQENPYVEGGYCQDYFTMSTNASPQPPPNSNPISTNTGKAVTSGLTTHAAGKFCDADKTQLKTAIGCIPTEPTQLINAFMRLVAGVAGGVAFLLMLFGAFQMITSAGNPDSLKNGQERFTSAIIGLLFVIFSVLLMQVIGVDILNIPGFTK